MMRLQDAAHVSRHAGRGMSETERMHWTSGARASFRYFRQRTRIRFELVGDSTYLPHAIPPLSPVIQSDDTLPRWLGRLARSLPTRTLGMFVGGGILLAVAGAATRSAGSWTMIGAGVCAACLGAWAIADRKLARISPVGAHSSNWVEHGGWRVLRGAAAVLGTLAAMALVVAIPFLLLGTWIS